MEQRKIIFYTETSNKSMELDEPALTQAKSLIDKAIEKNTKWLIINFPDVAKSFKVNMTHVTFIEYT